MQSNGEGGKWPRILHFNLGNCDQDQKLDLGVDLDQYVAALQKSRAVRIVPVDENTWVKSVRLEWAHRDPADRVVVAIAQSEQASIITADREIRSFYSDAIW